MHLEQIRFDEIFDVAACRGDFGFRSAGQVHYGVQLQGGALPRAGESLVLAFAEAGNWGTVLGWRTLADSAVTLAHPTWPFVAAQALGTLLYAPFFVGGGLLFGGPWAAAAAAALIAGIACYRIGRHARRNRAVTRALRSFVAGQALETTG